ncbi:MULTISPECIES: 3,4-dihydroxyphenylacetate 2,3-dioxygenase [Burkholderia]|uniref:3,4-dihydroxyphenylacetate 2,3-dioxygenase n=1 Tax=Burkholderia ubonensis TaxID=101571 RepID=A0A104S0R2_9BURK|nr:MULTISPECIES: 3,4-dihydroxyphenylacetate 2,3-dioxygenase [Burkholderia]AOI73225.1 3,4-dihydroxyphenylacetate 2,3-dioxygenase [Burkholderia ubonensis]AOK26570.1 3,4-dihydroxyphenylacetate 2,3-dioxygenase [Burkholderia ubonensis]KIP14687.1 3,4-dihydroxyphenylacetate 2,3-dioxygenase [Burkholderia sp. MSHR3999]KUZ12579.1 3,4-dihydroxyphenylacetate 2,3-dioxygenase [Burkholderia ubonensis]KUZ33774.1 3,4-dihydroxyphenylacetate 2,3-dioxygenase [Burkholderia ubonensis]
MGKLSLAAKITHVPSMYLSELPGRHHGCRAEAIRGHQLIGERCRALGVDTIVVSDVHWLVNAGYHVNCNARFSGVYTSNELPHFIRDMAYAYPGNPALGRLIAETATARGIATRAHEIDSLELEYGTLVPMRYMNADQHFKVVSIAGWCMWHTLDESRRFGEALLEAIEKSDANVAFLASGSLSHRFNDNGSPEESIHQISREFFRQVDLRVVELWKQGDFATFCKMLPEYSQHCFGEGGMHDTAMLLGLLGWDRYDKPVEIVTDYFASSGTGQINAIFPLP